MDLSFPSVRDGWLVALLWTAAIAMTASAVMVWREPGGPWIALACGLLSPLTLWILFDTGYRLDDEHLHVRSGPLRFRVRLDEIESVKPTRNPLSSPALSLDRLEIRRRGRWGPVLISPQRRREFLVALADRAPHLVLDEEAGALRPAAGGR